MTWMVAETHPYGNSIAEEHLRKQGYEPFNPQVRSQHVKRGALVERIRPYILGYIFVHVDDDQDWRPINYTRGVKRIMYRDAPGQKPAIIPVPVIEALQLLCNDNGYIKQVEADAALMRVGRVVRVHSGSFEGMVGPVTWTKGDRIRVMLSFLGTEREVGLGKSLVEVAG